MIAKGPFNVLPGRVAHGRSSHFKPLMVSAFNVEAQQRTLELV
jgi:hypothetical protein